MIKPSTATSKEPKPQSADRKAANEAIAAADAQRAMALPLTTRVKGAVIVIAEETGKGQRAVLSDLAAGAEPTLLANLRALAERYDRERAAKINAALGSTNQSDTAPSAFDSGPAR